MTDQPYDQCSRCGGAITQPEARLSVEGEALAGGPPVLALCPRCTRSFARWLKARRRRAEAIPAASVQPDTHTHTHTHTHRKSHKAKSQTEKLRREAIRHNLLAFALVTVAAVIIWAVSRFL